MALDLTKPLRTKETHLRVVYLGATNCGEWFAEREANGWEARCCLPYNVSEFYENVPERRTLDCWAAVLKEPHANGYMGSLWADKAAANEAVTAVKLHEALVHIAQDYEVGEGLA